MSHLSLKLDRSGTYNHSFSDQKGRNGIAILAGASLSLEGCESSYTFDSACFQDSQSLSFRAS